MKITPKILSIPPYISTTWSQIQTLYMLEKELVVRLTDGVTIFIPDLNDSEIKAIFTHHLTFTENTPSHPNAFHPPSPFHFFHTLSPSQIATPSPTQGHEGMTAMHLNFDSMESLSSALHHNAEQAHMPSLPSEILQKIAAIAKIMTPGDTQQLPKPEPHCNCPHCQIARAIHGQIERETSEPQMALKHHEKEEGGEKGGEESVTEKDLTFQQWEILQLDDKLYSVANRLDLLETYRVYLGHPVGCTCGILGCEHILAVLKS